MKQYKIYAKGNYIVVVDVLKNEYFYGTKKEVFVDKSNVNKNTYKIFNVKHFNNETVLQIPNILKEDGSAYSELEFDTFYQENTGNFNGGGIAPTGDYIPLTGTEIDKPVTGNIEFLGDGEDLSMFSRNDDNINYILWGDGNLTIANTKIDGSSATNIQVIQEFVSVYSTHPNTIGLIGNVDFSQKVTGDLDKDKLIYAQRKYVDDKVAQVLTEDTVGQFMDEDLVTKITPSGNDTILARDFLTNQAVEVEMSKVLNDGATGSFLSVDGKTITVVNGLITNIV